MPAVQPAPDAMQRRHSSASSSDTGSDHGLTSRHTSQENISLIPTRTSKLSTSKPVANPLQFVKVGPCDLSRYAQEQLKKAEEVKKVKPEKRDEAEDWQSNLDNWKVSRRKRQEHIIERVVEVKKLELEEHDRNRRRSKTFNEMLEDRNSKGRKTSLPVYQDDDNDLSDLGLSSSKANGDEDNVFHESKDSASSTDEASSVGSSVVNGKNGTTVNGYSKRDQREPSSEQEEYTYERAIQNYVNFTESRVRGRSLTPSESDSSKLTNGVSKKSSPPVPAKPRRGSCKIEEKLSELEQIKKKSMSTNDLTENTKKPLSVPKVDILKRREMFEKSQEEETNNVKNRLSGEFDYSKSIRGRVSSFGKPSDDLQSKKKTNRLSAEISVKDRLLNIEKQNSIDSAPSKSNPPPNSNIAISHSVKDRLSSLQKASSIETKPNLQTPQTTEKAEVKEKTTVHRNKANLSGRKAESSQSNTSNVDNTVSKNTESSIIKTVPKEEKLVNGEDDRDQSVMSPTGEMYESKRQQHYRHRSLDSLDVDSNDGLGNESFERVQSLEDLEFCRNYPASSVSGDTDREDSGIHTADVSSSVSQADDCDSHLDGEFHQQPTIFEEINKNPQLTSTLIVKQINQINVSDSTFEIPVEVVPGPEVGENSCSSLKLPLRLDCDPLPVILESPSEPIPPFTITEVSKATVSISLPGHSVSSHNIAPSQSNVTTNTESDSNSVDKSEIVNINSNLKTEQCSLILTACGGETSVANSVPVHTSPTSLSTLPSSAEVLHDNKSGALEICHKIDISELSAAPLLKPEVSVEAEYHFEPKEKFEDLLEYKVGVEGVGGHHLNALTVDVSGKSDTTENNTPGLTMFSNTDNSKLIDSIEVVFPLSPSTLEPPKEKPPPPPTEISDDEDVNSVNKSVSLRRLDSTKRIKKEIRQKRSSFLGIEGSNDDNYLEPELELVRRPPDISSFLAEEKRLEQLLYRQSICSESESRDSGVELEKHHDDLTWSTVHHSRDNSETYANTSTTSEEEEIVKKEREIIEMLEREEINRYSSTGQDQDNIGEKLAERLRELEAEKSRLEWEREEEMSRRKAEEAVRVEQQTRIQARELELCKQENTQAVQELDINTEMLMAERERLEAEQASLARQRDLLMQQQYNRSLTDVRVSEPPVPSYPTGDYRRSMQDLRAPEPVITCYRRPVNPPSSDNRRSMPDLAAQPRRPPPPIPPAKPLIIPRTQDKRMSSPQQMTRQTLQALSAAPKPRLNDNWVQAKRKPKENYNYQHWLIQEAEQRRITEHHQRQAPLPRRPVPPPPQTNGGWGTSSGQYTNWQPTGTQWGSPTQPTTQQQPRSDKPLPDSIIQTLTQRVQNRLHTADPNNNRRRMELSPVVETRAPIATSDSQEKMLSVSGKKKCSHCGDELGRGAAMIIESLRLFYHIDCFKCCVCCVQLGDGLMGTDVRVRNNKLHCHNCYSSDDGVKFSCV